MPPCAVLGGDAQPGPVCYGIQMTPVLTLALPTKAPLLAVIFLTLNESSKGITDIQKLFIFHSFDNQPAPCQYRLKCTCLTPFTAELELNHLSRYLGENMDV